MFIYLIFLTQFACSSGGEPNILQKTNGSEGNGNAGVLFHRTNEPNENAFTFLLPEGWEISGGITRVDPNASGGSGNAIEAKLYMKLSSPDNQGAMGWLPDTRFFDMRRYPGRNLAESMFPDGSNYNGMTVLKILTPEAFVKNIALPFAHPHALNVRITEVKKIPQLAEEYSRASGLMLGGYRFTYDAAILTIEYTENGIPYLEKMVCTIEDWGELGGGLWSNKETWYVRAEKSQFEKMAPVFATIGHSIKINPAWLAREIKSQQVNSQIAQQTQHDIARIEREITEHRAQTNSRINHDMFLTLTGQEEYINPFSGETEQGTNEWNYRWENERGDVIYSDNQNYNPNQDAELKIQGFKKSEIRKR